MAFPVFTHRLTVTASDITPRGPLSCGTDGDEGVTRLNFHFESPAAGNTYRLEIVRGDGVYDITEPLVLATDASELDFDIPAVWTAAGTAAVRLVEYTVTDGVETQRHYYPPFLLTFAYRDEGMAAGDAPLRWQELLTRAEKVMSEAAAAADVAAEASEAAHQSVERLQSEAESALQTFREASDVVGGFVSDCADMRDAAQGFAETAQGFADEAASAARRAEEAAASVGEHTHDASSIPYDGSEQYIGGSNVEEALNRMSAELLNLGSMFSGHEHDAAEMNYARMTPSGVGVSTAREAFDALFDEVGGVSETLDEILTIQNELMIPNGDEVAY